MITNPDSFEWVLPTRLAALCISSRNTAIKQTPLNISPMFVLVLSEPTRNYPEIYIYFQCSCELAVQFCAFVKLKQFVHGIYIFKSVSFSVFDLLNMGAAWEQV